MSQNKISEDIGNNFTEKLVELIRKHKILYDTTAEGYSNFMAQDETWRKIASELNEDACKLKWKNIRSCYTRYLRQIATQSCKTTRTYYLAKHLRFLLPFCKQNSRTANEETGNPFVHFDDLDGLAKSEPTDDETSTKLEPDTNLDEDSREKFCEEVNTNNKRQMWETREYEFYKKSKVSESNDEAEMNFFRSLLPDIRKMNGKQRNQLKISILKAIDNILYSGDS